MFFYGVSQTSNSIHLDLRPCLNQRLLLVSEDLHKSHGQEVDVDVEGVDDN